MNDDAAPTPGVVVRTLAGVGLVLFLVAVLCALTVFAHLLWRLIALVWATS